MTYVGTKQQPKHHYLLTNTSLAGCTGRLLRGSCCERSWPQHAALRRHTQTELDTRHKDRDKRQETRDKRQEARGKRQETRDKRRKPKTETETEKRHRDTDTDTDINKDGVIYSVNPHAIPQRQLISPPHTTIFPPFLLLPPLPFFSAAFFGFLPAVFLLAVSPVPPGLFISRVPSFPFSTATMFSLQQQCFSHQAITTITTDCERLSNRFIIAGKCGISEG